MVAGNSKISGAIFSEDSGAVRLRTDRKGPAGAVEVTGGDANSVLLFPTTEVVGTLPGDVYILPFPLPFDISYQVDFFTKTRQDLRSLTSSFLTRFPFTDQAYLNLCVPGLANQLLRVTLDRMDETSDLETGEDE